MKIAVTGGNGRLGRLLISQISNSFEFVELGRSPGCVNWTLGTVPDPVHLKDVKALIHLAWSLENREKDYHLNIGGTFLLAQRAREMEIPFLMISSTSALGNSFYGRSKAEAEKLVISQGGYCLRLGLVQETNEYQFPNRKTFIKVIPDLRTPIHTTSPESFVNLTLEFLKSNPEARAKFRNHNYTVITGTLPVRDVLDGDSFIKLLIQKRIFLILLKILSIYSIKYRNLRDAYLGLIHDCKESECEITDKFSRPL